MENRILPLYKKGNKEEIGNFKPINNLCSMSKINERLILKSLLEIFQLTNLIYFGLTSYKHAINASSLSRVN
jgi:hypothetical protein